MHELSIALSILDGVAEEVERQGGARVHAIHLKLGPLSGVVKEALEFSYEMARESTPFEKARLTIHEMPVIVFCPDCDAERQPASMQALVCPVCGRPTPEVRGGRELEIVSLELDG